MRLPPCLNARSATASPSCIRRVSNCAMPCASTPGRRAGDERGLRKHELPGVPGPVAGTDRFRPEHRLAIPTIVSASFAAPCLPNLKPLPRRLASCSPSWNRRRRCGSRSNRPSRPKTKAQIPAEPAFQEAESSPAGGWAPSNSANRRPGSIPPPRPRAGSAHFQLSSADTCRWTTASGFSRAAAACGVLGRP